MASITYIIGNGLDLSLGLKTSYRDFYEYVKHHKLHPENRIYKAIAESPESWSDFELALGRYTDYIDRTPEQDKKAESIKFHDELEDLRVDLADYLEKEELSISEDASTTSITPDGYSTGLPVGQKQTISIAASQSRVVLHFITLNYTRTLEVVVANSVREFASYNVGTTEPLHIHGDLIEDLTLGVSDESQVSASMAGAEKDDLIKPSLIKSMNDGRIDALNRMIINSSIVVLFGTSIGETDKYIWQVVTDWLYAGNQRYVIIHKHDDAYTNDVRRSSRRRKQFDSNAQDKLLRYSGLDGDAIAELKNRIFVIHNSKSLFVSK